MRIQELIPIQNNDAAEMVLDFLLDKSSKNHPDYTKATKAMAIYARAHYGRNMARSITCPTCT